MITAIPVNDDRVANHFTKASHLVLVMSAVWSSAGQKIPRWAQIVQVNGSWLTCWFNSKSAALWSVTSGNGCWVNYWGIDRGVPD